MSKEMKTGAFTPIPWEQAGRSFFALYSQRPALSSPADSCKHCNSSPVFLPEMMTGQILGSASPLLAIKYQISIMIVILASTAMSATFTIMTTTQTTFDGFGVVKKEIYKEKGKKEKGKREKK